MGYLDYAGIFGNPASHLHHFGTEAQQAVNGARQQVASLVNAEPREIVWTSGATESNNLAIKGAAWYCADKGRHIVTSAIEHKAVLDSCAYLETKGFEVTYMLPNEDGIITPEIVERHIRHDTILVSLMHVNNEIGTVTDIPSIGEITSSRAILLHVDAAQSVPRLPIDLGVMKVDLLSMSGHKMYGPKGVGALYIRHSPRRVKIDIQMHGGGHENGFRSGTVPTHQVVGMGEAAAIIMRERENECAHIQGLTALLIAQLQNIPAFRLNAERAHTVPGIVNACFPYANSDSVMMNMTDVAISSGSACTSADVTPSHVLRALGVEEECMFCSLRFSIGRFTTREDIMHVARRICEVVSDLRGVSLDWARFIDMKEQKPYSNL